METGGEFERKVNEKKRERSKGNERDDALTSFNTRRKSREEEGTEETARLALTQRFSPFFVSHQRRMTFQSRIASQNQSKNAKL